MLENESNKIDWKIREQLRCEVVYKKLPMFLTSAIDFQYSHFAHVPKNNNVFNGIAFTENDDKGSRDIQTVMKLGRYITRFHPSVSNDTVQKLVREYEAWLNPEGISVKLSFESSVDAINEIFETKMYACDSSVESCMFGKFEDWPVRPYHVYADNEDINVAVLRNNAGKVITRTVINNKNKSWVRLYAVKNENDSSNGVYCSMLESALRDAGYTFSGSLSGCRIKIMKANGGNIIAPYIDGDNFLIEYDSKHFMIAEDSDGADYEADNTNGFAEELESKECCNDCGGRFGSEELTFVECSEENVCIGCLRENYIKAISSSRGNTQYVRSEDAIDSCNEEYYTQDYAERVLIFKEDEWHESECSCDCMNQVECDECSGEFNENDLNYHKGKSICDGCLKIAEDADAENENKAEAEAEPKTETANLFERVFENV